MNGAEYAHVGPSDMQVKEKSEDEPVYSAQIKCLSSL